MAQLDKIHQAVKNALVKDGWTITAENFQFRFKELKFYGDIQAKRIVAEKGEQKIVVEVKSFLGVSAITEFHQALGQYRVYKRILSQLDPSAKVYLAVTEAVYNEFFSGDGVQFLVEQEKVALFAVNL